MNPKQKSGAATPETILAVVTIFVLVVIAYGSYRKETYQMPQAYDAWVKLTGNPKSLTYDEWRSLVKATRDPSSIYENR